MKKITSILLTLAMFAGITTSCQKEDMGKGLRVTATVEDCTDINGSKTSLNPTNNVLTWVAGDPIFVIVPNTMTYGYFSATPQAQATRADFTWISSYEDDPLEMNTNDFGSSEEFLAYYPANSFSWFDFYTVNLPSIRTSVDGSLKDYPMAAYTTRNSPEDDVNFHFKNLCGVLKVHLKKANTVITKISVTVDEPICGLHQMSFDDNGNISTFNYYNPYSYNPDSVNTVMLNCNQSIHSGHDFYIYLPAGEYHHLKLSILTSDYTYCIKGPAPDGNTVVIERSKYSTLTLEDDNLEFVGGDEEFPQGLPGRFSLNANGKRVCFSRGNLQYDPGTQSWHFATNQWDYVGDGTTGTVEGNNTYASATWNGATQSYDYWYASPYIGRIDLFAFGTGHNPMGVREVSWGLTAEYGTTSDWGDNAIVNGSYTDPTGTWEVPSGEDWGYLIYARPNANSLKCKAIITGVNGEAGVKGMVLLPDDWTLPSGISPLTTSDTRGWPNTFTVEQWAVMEAAGAVFFPAAGRKYSEQGFEGDMGEEGWYWSSTAQGSSMAIRGVTFYDDGIWAGVNPIWGSTNSDNRGSGYAIRMMHVVNPGLSK